MAEYIEREAAKRAVKHIPWCDWKAVGDCLDSIPAAVEVVRCGECKHRSSDYDILGDYLCEKRGCRFFCKDDDFCSYGERRDSDG